MVGQLLQEPGNGLLKLLAAYLPIVVGLNKLQKALITLKGVRGGAHSHPDSLVQMQYLLQIKAIFYLHLVGAALMNKLDHKKSPIN